MKSDTPETDANTIHRMGQLRTAVVDVEFARRLERERDEALKKLWLTTQVASAADTQDTAVAVCDRHRPRAS